MYFQTNRLGIRIPICVNFPGGRRRFAEDPDAKWILFSHGNAEDLGNATMWTNHLSEAGPILIVSYDYSGYGLSAFDNTKSTETNDGQVSDGAKTEAVVQATEDTLYADAESVLNFAETVLGLKRENAVLWGRSLGCSACCHLTVMSKREDRPFAGVILQAPFTSVIEVGLNVHLMNPPRTDIFRNYDKIKQNGGFDCPCFVIHGTNDWIVNWWHGREMASLVPEKMLWPPLYVNSGHNDLEQSCESFVPEIIEFADYCIWRLEE